VVMPRATSAIGRRPHRTLPRSVADLLASFVAEASTKDSNQRIGADLANVTSSSY